MDFHDRQAELRRMTFVRHPQRLLVDAERYLDHETWIRPAFARLGNVAGKSILDLGCGHGMASVVLAARGANVVACDLSAGYLAEARQRAIANHVSVKFVQADAHRLPFADATFDRIWGNAIVHHLVADEAAREIHRVLKPTGQAIFCEPWGENPLLNWSRKRLHYHGKERTSDEKPLGRPELLAFEKVFSHIEVQGFQLLAMLRRLMPGGLPIPFLEACDNFLLHAFPAMQRLCRYVVIVLKRDSQVPS
ncbi:MAG: hypothetical protein KatS3mg105_3632 [Gemmatales bacterium]|nr:MAG: hypothetical protein KatS3mg105_3632 [Gemmatales bacterium]